MQRNDKVLHCQLEAVHLALQGLGREPALMLAWEDCDMVGAGGHQGSATGNLRQLDSGAR